MSRMSEFWRNFATAWMIIGGSIVGVTALVATFVLFHEAVHSGNTRRRRVRSLAGLMAALLGWTILLALLATWDRTAPR